MQHHVSPAILALPGVKPKDRIDFFLQKSLPKHAKNPLTVAMLAASSASGSRRFDKLFG
jgi:hypothetical protein